MTLLEALKKPFIKGSEEEIKEPSNQPTPHNITSDLSDEYEGITAFGGDEKDVDFGDYGIISPIQYQNRVIKRYRELANNGDVSYAIDQIVNEMIFSIEDDILKIDFDDVGDKVKEKVVEKFNKILKIMNIQENIHIICRQLYIDGQINVALTFDEKNLKGGIKKLRILEPFNLYFDKSDNKWKYLKDNNEFNLYYIEDDKYDDTFSVDELIHVDFKLYKNIQLGEGEIARINYGYLERALKYVNQLNTLESLLVPLRYSRSVTRRLFNVDVADLPPKKAKELMDKIRAEFKYKKTYDIETGNIKNIKSTQPIVEDYWLSNRNGGRGTTVDIMDEKGALMDLEDIIYITKKLFTALKIPANRNPYLDDVGDFGYDENNVRSDEMSFYLFIDKLRRPLISLFKRILKREMIYSEDFTEKDWDEIKDKIEIKFTSKSIFLDNMKKDLFLKSLGNFQDIKEDIGKVISLEKALNITMGWSSKEIEEELEKIKSEKSNPLYKEFYSDEDF